jgi:hypothetical protein
MLRQAHHDNVGREDNLARLDLRADKARGRAS